MVGWSDAAGEAFGVGEGEGAEGLFPALDDGTVDEPAGGGALVGFLAGFLGAVRRARLSSMSRIAGHSSLITASSLGKVAAVLDDLAVLVVQRLDGVGGVDDLADRRGELEERDEPLPGVLPGR